MLIARRKRMNKPPGKNSADEQEEKPAPTARVQFKRGAAQRRRQHLFNEAYLATPPAQRQEFYDATKKRWT
jgi:hypothetical protein